MRIQVPYLSQWRDVSDPFWKERACGIACLGMVTAHVSPGLSIDLDLLIAEADRMGARDPRIGWIHAKLIEIGKTYGIDLESRVFRSKEGEIDRMEEGISAIKKELLSGRPVIASVRRYFASNGAPHMVVLVGLAEGEDGEVFIVHDPDAQEQKDGEYLTVSMDLFRQNWRKLAIFLTAP